MNFFKLDIWKQTVFAHNELWRYVAIFGILLLSLVIGRIIRLIFEKHGEKLKSKDSLAAVGLVFIYIAKPIVMLCFAVGFYGSMLVLKITPTLQPAVNLIIRMLFSITFGYMIYNLVDIIDFYLTRWSKKTENKIDDMLVPLFRKTLRITVVIIVVVYIAENLSGKTIGTLIAGLGIGGLAVALAAQDTLKNFFASIVIMIDQPFQMGDRVVINNHDGPVEEVGFRSTKIRTLEGHLVTIPNSEVANQSVLNIGKRPYIRRLSNITITYDTPPEKVDEAVAILKGILEPYRDKMPPDLPPRVYFSDFNDWSLNILMIYWYAPPDYWAFQEFNNQVNVEILKRFNAAGIDFAFPSQTVYLANDDKRQLAVRILEGKK